MPVPALDPETGCWIWQGSQVNGYGKISSGPGGKGPAWAHRFYWELEKGKIPEGRHVHHTCKNRICVNTDHMMVLTKRSHGQLTGKAKITLGEVRDIRVRLRHGERSVDLAAEFGLAPQTICDIKAGRSWQEDAICPNCGHQFDPFEE